MTYPYQVSKAGISTLISLFCLRGQHGSHITHNLAINYDAQSQSVRQHLRHAQETPECNRLRRNAGCSFHEHIETSLPHPFTNRADCGVSVKTGPTGHDLSKLHPCRISAWSQIGNDSNTNNKVIFPVLKCTAYALILAIIEQIAIMFSSAIVSQKERKQLARLSLRPFLECFRPSKSLPGYPRLPPKSSGFLKWS